MTIDLDYLAELAREASPGPWRPVDETHGHWGVTARPPGVHATEIVHAHSDGQGYGNGSSEANARFIAALDPQTVLTLIDAASAWLGSRPRPDPKPPVLAPGDTWYPWWVVDRTGVSKPKGMWSKAIADSSVAALGDAERYAVVQGLPEE